jgi:putative hydrolase of the HAD superfamily
MNGFAFLSNKVRLCSTSPLPSSSGEETWIAALAASGWGQWIQFNLNLVMSALRDIRAVTLDVGGTLIKPSPSVGHVYAEVASRHGWKKVSPEILNRRFSAAWKGLKNFNHTRDEWAALVDETFGPSEQKPSETFFPEIYDRFAEPEAWHVFEDALPSLDALAARDINLAIVSNWDERLRPLLEKLKLNKYFQAVIISCEVAFTKPSPVIFEQAARMLGEAPEHILHVGDSAAHDVTGAKSAGFHAVLLERGRVDAGGQVIGSLMELDGMVG